MIVNSGGEHIKVTPDIVQRLRYPYCSPFKTGWLTSMLDCVYVDLGDTYACVFQGMAQYKEADQEFEDLGVPLTIVQPGERFSDEPHSHVLKALRNYVIDSAELLCKQATS